LLVGGIAGIFAIQIVNFSRPWVLLDNAEELVQKDEFELQLTSVRERHPNPLDKEGLGVGQKYEWQIEKEADSLHCNKTPYTSLRSRFVAATDHL
jgi:hypothetical protein